MTIDELLGRVCRLSVVRLGTPGAFLAVDPRDRSADAPVVLLPRGQLLGRVRPGAEVEVFVHLDSEDRPIATTARPRITLGEVAFLEVTDETHFGAFVDWGLPKDLLVPLGEQTREIRVGDRHPVGLIVDETGRLAGTMRVSEMLRAPRPSSLDEWVEGEAWRKEDGLGVFVIVERRHVGLLPESEPHALGRGEAARFRVARVLPDGKFELSLRRHAHEELADDADRILATLGRSTTPFGDHSSPDAIRAAFGLSKKAFKRGVGRLLKRGLVELDHDGTVVVVADGRETIADDVRRREG